MGQCSIGIWPFEWPVVSKNTNAQQYFMLFRGHPSSSRIHRHTRRQFLRSTSQYRFRFDHLSKFSGLRDSYEIRCFTNPSGRCPRGWWKCCWGRSGCITSDGVYCTVWRAAYPKSFRPETSTTSWVVLWTSPVTLTTMALRQVICSHFPREISTSLLSPVFGKISDRRFSPPMNGFADGTISSAWALLTRYIYIAWPFQWHRITSETCFNPKAACYMFLLLLGQTRFQLGPVFLERPFLPRSRNNNRSTQQPCSVQM